MRYEISVSRARLLRREAGPGIHRLDWRRVCAFAFVALTVAAPAVAAWDGAGRIAVPNPRHFKAPWVGWIIDARILLAFGLMAQTFFSARIVLQAWASHRRGESFTPPSFWYASFVAGLMLACYFFVRSDPVGLLQQAIMVAIYMRNIYLIRKEQHGPRFNRPLAKAVAAFIGIILLFFLVCMLASREVDPARKHVANPKFFILPFTGHHIPSAPLLTFGFVGMAIFSGRFFVQWLASERARRSVVPDSFWVLSAIGSLMLLLYFVVRSDPVAVLGQITGLPAYLYNLALIRRSKAAGNEDASPPAYDV